MEILADGAAETTDTLSKQIYQADPPYNLLYDLESSIPANLAIA